jgi:hypothetical protein
VLLMEKLQVPVPEVVVQVLVLLLFTAATVPTGTVNEPLMLNLEFMIDGGFGPLW